MQSKNTIVRIVCIPAEFWIVRSTPSSALKMQKSWKTHREKVTPQTNSKLGYKKLALTINYREFISQITAQNILPEYGEVLGFRSPFEMDP